MQISTIITIAVILVFFLVGVLSVVTILTNEESVRYTLLNSIKYGHDKAIFVSRKQIPLPEQIDSTDFNISLAHSCCLLIENVYAMNMKVEGTTIEKIIDYDKSDKTPFAYVLTKGDVIYVVFRGTWKMSEWFNNLKLNQLDHKSSSKLYNNSPTFMRVDPNIMIHNGFLNVYDRIYKQLFSTIEHLTSLPGSNYSICVTGHSLGGSVASIVGAELRQRGYSNIIVYTFGTPRTGNPTYAGFIEKLDGLEMYSVLNTEDSVAQAIMAVSPNNRQHDSPYFYSFCGNDIYFSNNWYSTYYNHSIVMYIDALNLD